VLSLELRESFVMLLSSMQPFVFLLKCHN